MSTSSSLLTATSSLVTKYKSFFGDLSSDIIYLLAIFFVLFAYAMYFGRGRIVSFILAFYPATLLYNTFPFMEKVILLKGEKLILLNQLGVFLLFLVLLNIIINRYIISISDYSSSSHIMRNGGLAFISLVLIVVFSYGTLNLDLFHDFAPPIDNLFNGEDKIFYWNIVSIIFLAFI